MATETKLVTYDDYRALPVDGKRYEIIGGELFMTASPNTIHERVSKKLLIILDQYVEKHDLGEVFVAPYDVVLSMTDVVQPDLFFIGKERSEIITKMNVVAAPDLVVEVLSESTAVIDRNRKKALYENYGVKEYWIVDPDENRIQQYVLLDNSFALNAKLDESGKLDSNVVEKFELKLSDIFIR